MQIQPSKNALTHDPAAWDVGFAAGERGVFPFRCPYPATTRQAWSWSSGFIEGKAKRDGYEYSRGTRPPHNAVHRDGAGSVQELLEGLEDDKGQLPVPAAVCAVCVDPLDGEVF